MTDTPSELFRDTPLLMTTAARIAFPDGSVSAITLRAEAARGKLKIWRVGKKYYTTLAAIDDMVEKCHVPPKARTYICGDATAAILAGQFETEGMKSARAALLASVKELKKSSQLTSLKNTARTSAQVIRPKFPSRTSSRFTSKNEPL